ncbi:hypothetical protein FQA39_LY09784 [Lamprigera yunnana]|nr:hypothetical protein FQA39_LY09784 [Lamprigera yunnana]
MPGCCVKFCTSSGRKGQSLFRTPANLSRRQTWLTLLSPKQGYYYSHSDYSNLRICELHFSETQFIVVGNKMKLKNYAVPDLLQPAFRNKEIMANQMMDGYLKSEGLVVQRKHIRIILTEIDLLAVQFTDTHAIFSKFMSGFTCGYCKLQTPNTLPENWELISNHNCLNKNNFAIDENNMVYLDEGRNRKTWTFFEKIDYLMAKDPTVEPPTVVHNGHLQTTRVITEEAAALDVDTSSSMEPLHQKWVYAFKKKENFQSYKKRLMKC